MLGLSNLTGLRKFTDLVDKFGYCLNCKLTSETETVPSRNYSVASKRGIILPCQLLSQGKIIVHAHFQIDIFDKLAGRAIGRSSAHSTHLF